RETGAKARYLAAGLAIMAWLQGAIGWLGGILKARAAITGPAGRGLASGRRGAFRMGDRAALPLRQIAANSPPLQAYCATKLPIYINISNRHEHRPLRPRHPATPATGGARLQPGSGGGGEPVAVTLPQACAAAGGGGHHRGLLRPPQCPQ